MGEFSLFWALFIIAIMVCIYKLVALFINSKKNKIIWLVAVISICFYSGIGIAYSTISKKYIGELALYLIVLGISFAFFTKYDLRIDNHSLYACKNQGYYELSQDKREFWNSDFASRLFITVLICYFILRIGSLIYPVNKLSSLTLSYSTSSDGENNSILNSLASYIKPMAYVGYVFAFKKVRYVAIFLFFDQFITLLATGYLSRHMIIEVFIICLLLYFNNDLSDAYISNSKKKRRIIITLIIVLPIVFYLMIYLMTIRTTGNDSWTIMSFVESEIDYPKHYDSINFLASQYMTAKDMLLHILDSFIPFIHTPGYTSNLNIWFSEQVSGVSSNLSWFSILLPSILGESKLIFGQYFFWAHAIIISFMMSMITRITKDNPKLIILYYYYLTCVMKAARAGYVEISRTVIFNIIVFSLFIWISEHIYISLKYRSGIRG